MIYDSGQHYFIAINLHLCMLPLPEYFNYTKNLLIIIKYHHENVIENVK